MTYWKTARSVFVIGAATLGAVGACAKQDPAAEYPTPGATQGDEPAPSPQRPQRADLNERQIVGVLTTVDAGEIEQARVALTRAIDPRVKQFAAHMVDQHTESTQKASLLASQYDLMPAPSSVATSLQDKAARTKTLLDETNESAFDLAYMKSQVQLHQELLEMLEAQLTPAARNEALVARLRAASTMVENHLHEAREIASLLHPSPAAAGSAQTKGISQ